jgi:hypothetical protein
MATVFLVICVFAALIVPPARMSEGSVTIDEIDRIDGQLAAAQEAG